MWVVLAAWAGAGPAVGQEIRRALPTASTANEQARLLAALPLPEDSLLKPWQTSPDYQRHVTAYDKTWQRFYEKHFGPKREWALAHVFPKIPRPEALYYLFGGPDVINAVALFPGLKDYVLVGLEPVGSITPPESLNSEQLMAGLENLRKATDTTLQFSFFITKDMKVDLELTEFKGVLPVLYTFLVRSGHLLLDTTMVTIDSQGNLVENGTTGLPGVRIRFTAGPGYPIQNLYFIRADLSDSGLQGKSSALVTWMKQFPEGVGYLKAASYLMHETYFSKVRDFLLGHCFAILQDDSGIPFRYFAREQWRLYLYGSYTQPIELFEKKLQPDLKQAYERVDLINPLPFGTGYNWQPGESNLLLAIRRNLPTPAEEPMAPAALPVDATVPALPVNTAEDARPAVRQPVIITPGG